MIEKFDPNIPYNDLPHLPPEKSLFNDISLWELEAKARSTTAELKGLANIIPNQSILINAIVLEEAKDSSEIENIITTRDKLYNGIYSDSKKIDKSTEEVIHYRKALMYGFDLIKNQGFLRKNDIDKIQELIVENKLDDVIDQNQIGFLCDDADCQSAQTITSGQSNVLVSTSSKWYVVNEVINGWQANQLGGRSIFVNGQQVTAGQSLSSITPYNGKYYFHFTIGENTWTEFSFW